MTQVKILNTATKREKFDHRAIYYKVVNSEKFKKPLRDDIEIDEYKKYTDARRLPDTRIYIYPKGEYKIHVYVYPKNIGSWNVLQQNLIRAEASNYRPQELAGCTPFRASYAFTDIESAKKFAKFVIQLSK